MGGDFCSRGKLVGSQNLRKPEGPEFTRRRRYVGLCPRQLEDTIISGLIINTFILLFFVQHHMVTPVIAV